PVCSGAEIQVDGSPRWDDLERLAASLNRPTPIDRIGPQRFLAPLAPPLAARAEGSCVDPRGIDDGFLGWRTACEALVVEGAGGWLCPLTETRSFADWVEQWRFPVLIVARRGLGTINHTLLTIAAIRSRRLPIIGVILNQSTPQDDDPSVSDNAREIEARSGVPVLGELLWNQTELRQGDRAVRMHWWSLMREPASETGRRANGESVR
ncbi:MAG TPA: dethiobiotin synthase, partial [Planctomycetaceae bacterium]|nr:dethiobiotin synthase [Planctomycetaceae bacterium]